jgi:predicted Zn finger-like uncharacterized protein
VIFACDRCGRRYSVPDERVRGRAFRVTCKACGNVISVKLGAPASTPEPAPPAPAAARPPPVPAASTAAAHAERTTTGPLIQVSGLGAAPVRPHDSSRALTSAEMAWMSDHDGRPAGPAPEPEAGEDVDVEEQAPAPQERAGQPGPGLARAVVAAVLLGLVAAAVVGFFVWPGWRSTPPAAPPKTAVAPPPPPASPAPSPTTAAALVTPPPVAAAPEPASVPPVVEPAPAPPPAPAPRVGPGAHFEPGTVTVGKIRRKEAPKLNRKDRKLLDLLARKHDQAAPEPVEKLDLDTARSLDPAAVERVIGESQGAFSGCVTRAAKVAGLPSSRRATLLLTVAGTGDVSSAWLAEAEVSRTGLGRCLVGAARRLVFPAFEGDPVDVSVPLTLEAR